MSAFLLDMQLTSQSEVSYGAPIFNQLLREYQSGSNRVSRGVEPVAVSPVGEIPAGVFAPLVEVPDVAAEVLATRHPLFARVVSFFSKWGRK